MEDNKRRKGLKKRVMRNVLQEGIRRKGFEEYIRRKGLERRVRRNVLEEHIRKKGLEEHMGEKAWKKGQKKCFRRGVNEEGFGRRN